jgi:aspartate aminotransferase-like enzyme
LSNVTGECLPLAELAGLAHAHGARIAVDGAQLVPHRRVDIAASGIDYLAFSGHKISRRSAPACLSGAATGWTPPRRTWRAAARSARWASTPPTGPPRPRGTKAAPRT